MKYTILFFLMLFTCQAQKPTLQILGDIAISDTGVYTPIKRDSCNVFFYDYISVNVYEVGYGYNGVAFLTGPIYSAGLSSQRKARRLEWDKVYFVSGATRAGSSEHFIKIPRQYGRTASTIESANLQYHWAR